MNAQLRNLVRLFSFSTVFACGGEPEQTNNNQPPPPPPPPAAEYCDGYERGCERQVECGVVVYNHASTKEECLAQTGCALVDTATLAAQGIELDPTKITQCKTKIDVLSCEALAEFRGGTPRGLESCGTFTRGTIDEGEACSSLGFEACVDGTTCDFGAGQCPGICKRIHTACTQDGCAENEYCSYTTGECTAQGLEGASCEPNYVNDQTRRSCAGGLHCLSVMDQGATCTARIPLGEACDQSIDVELCAEGSYCDPTTATPTCVARLEKDVTCGFIGQCREDLYCDFGTNLCSEQKELGESCNDSAGSCVLGLMCTGGVCKVSGEVEAPVEPKTIAREGEECGVGVVCGLGLVCALDAEQNAFCAPAFGPGAECEAVNDAFSCARGLCDFSSNVCPEILEVGDACAPDGLYTGCPFALCIDGRCAAVEEMSCGSAG
jgi:hypothetical protein